MAHVEKEAVTHGVPMDEGHVATNDVGPDHPGEVGRRLRHAELGRVAELALLQIVDGTAQLDGHGEGIDALVDALPAHGLRPEEHAVGLAEDDLDGEQCGAGVIPGVGVRVEVDLLEIVVAQR